ncbi:MAG: hypothetical protein V1859_01700 [archaeon]
MKKTKGFAKMNIHSLILCVLLVLLLAVQPAFGENVNITYSKIVGFAEDLNMRNMDAERILELHIEAKEALQKNDYILYEKKVNQAYDAYLFAISLYESQQVLDKNIVSLGSLNYSQKEIKKKAYEISYELSVGNYEQAKIYLDYANSEINNISKDVKKTINTRLSALNATLLQNGIKLRLIESYYNSVNSAQEASDISKLAEILQNTIELEKSIGYLVLLKQFEINAKENNVPTIIFKDISDEANNLIEKSRFESVKELYLLGREKYNKAIGAYAAISDAQTKIAKLNSTVTDAAESEIAAASFALEKAKKQFNESDFESSLLNAKDAIAKAEGIENKNKVLSAITLSRLNVDFIGFIKKNWIYLFALFVAIIIFWVYIYKKIQILVYQYKLKKAIEQKNNLISCIKKLQDDYYNKKSMPRPIYDARLDAYQEGLIRLTREIPLLKNAIAKEKKR